MSRNLGSGQSMEISIPKWWFDRDKDGESIFLDHECWNKKTKEFTAVRRRDHVYSKKKGIGWCVRKRGVSYFYDSKPKNIWQKLFMRPFLKLKNMYADGKFYNTQEIKI